MLGGNGPPVLLPEAGEQPKRRRLVGKQPSTEVPPALHGEATRDERAAVKTLVRDQWVAVQMRAQGLSGHAARQKLRSAWVDVPSDQKLRELQSKVFPPGLAPAAQEVKTQWQHGAQVPLVPDEARVTHYRGKGTMFRWSGPWSVLSGSASAPVERLCAGLRQQPQVCELWEEFSSFFASLQKKFRLERWTTALELHCEVTQRTGTPSVHFHAMFDGSRSVALPSAELRFKNANPFTSSDAPQGRGRSSRRSFDQGHFYLQVPKVGGIFVATNYEACTAFAIAPDWVTNLWQCHKISDETARMQYVRAKKHIKAYLDNVDYHQKCVEDSAVALRKADALASLEPYRKRAKPLPLVDAEFLPQFSQPMFRRKFLVLTGPSCVGKTLYGLSLDGASKTLVVDCGGATQPDLRCFRPLQHTAVVFDEASAAMVVNHRKVFQGTTQEVALGHSGTNIYTYRVWLRNVKLIVTTNRWYEDLAVLQPSDQAWLEQNAIVVQCTQKLYQES